MLAYRMRIVVRNSPTLILAELTWEDAAALRAWYGNAASNAEKAMALAVIRQAR